MSLKSKLLSLIGTGEGLGKLADKIIDSRYTKEERAEMDYKVLEMAELSRARSEEVDHLEFMKQLEMYEKEQELHQQDRVNARSREIEITKLDGATWLQKNFSHVVATVFALFAFTVIIIVLTGNAKADERTQERIMTIAEYVMVAIISYYLGSSIGSSRKQEVIERKGTRSSVDAGNKKYEAETE